jgi:hypothetical protein
MAAGSLLARSAASIGSHAPGLLLASSPAKLHPHSKVSRWRN